MSGGVGVHATQNPNDDVDQESCMLYKVPVPIYRHAVPSGPWPWMDFNEDVPAVISLPNRKGSYMQPWRGYPQCLFPDWTETRVKCCGILTACPVGESNVFKVDMLLDGIFSTTYYDRPVTIKGGPTESAFWSLLNHPRANHIRVRAMFVKNMTKEVLQMLGTRYDIDPFFFSSSTNWIPSRYQESLVSGQGDHITIVLPFICVISRDDASPIPSRLQPALPSQQEDGQVMDAQSPLYLNSCDKYILQDLLSVHMVRDVQSSTIISIHPKSRGKTAERLRSLINLTGDSVYWSKVFCRSKDPTFLLLCFLWYAMYEWGVLFETLHSHISQLERRVLDSDNIKEMQHLHILQAHLLYYRNLLADFEKSVIFLQKTSNPAMQVPLIGADERIDSELLMKQETDNLLSEIEKLESHRVLQVRRLQNVITLALATVNIDGSGYTQKPTIVTDQYSTALKQIAYLMIVFLPANFVANVFSMNIIEINPYGRATLGHYIAGAVGLTVFALWLTVAMQVDSMLFERGSPVWKRMVWPVFFVWKMWIRVYNQTFGLKQEKA